jgi:regulator of sigma E protease
MLIISAGVIMNVILGAICFIAVYRWHGVDRPPAVVWKVDPGSPAWQKGVRTDSVVTRIDSIKNPYFDDLKIKVALSQANRPVLFTFRFDGEDRTIDLLPRKDDNNKVPMIGVMPPFGVRLAPRLASKRHDLPVLYESAAAAARAVLLEPGDVAVASTDEDGQVTPLPADSRQNLMELCRRMRKLVGKPMVLSVLRKGGEAEPDKIELPARGFDFDDAIMGTTDPATPDDVFNVTELAKAPDYLIGDKPGEDRDPFDLRRRMRELAGKPIVVRVRREGVPEPVDLLVPPAYHCTLGLRMEMGKVAAVRDGSPAKGHIEPGDQIERVIMCYDGKEVRKFDRIDPVRLSDDLARTAATGQDRRKWTARVTVLRPKAPRNDEGRETVEVTLNWDDAWTSNAESAMQPASPTSIPQLGIAFFIESRVKEVTDDELKKLIEPNDEIAEIRFREGGNKIDSPEEWTKWYKMKSKRDSVEVYDQWAFYFEALQHYDHHDIEVKVLRNNKPQEPVRLKAKEAVPTKDDPGWPLTDRGEYLTPSYKTQKTDSLVEALVFGYDRTVSSIQQIYLNLGSLISGRVSVELLGGPIEIASQTFAAAEDPWILILWLGMISVNLAVVNFLPIPILDGGHMVFLIYEKLRGKPPSEGVRAAATYLGLAIILGLMAFVFYLDIRRRIVGG